MPRARIAPELAVEMEALRSAGRANARLPVIVAVEPPSASGEAEDLDAVTAAIHAAQEPVVRMLARLGVTEVRRQSLASAIEAELGLAEIEALAAEPTVRRLMSNRISRVTADEQVS